MGEVWESALACLFRLTNVYFELKTKSECLLKTIKIYRYLSALLSRLLSNLNRLIHGRSLLRGMYRSLRALSSVDRGGATFSSMVVVSP